MWPAGCSLPLPGLGAGLGSTLLLQLLKLGSAAAEPHDLVCKRKGYRKRLVDVSSKNEFY